MRNHIIIIFSFFFAFQSHAQSYTWGNKQIDNGDTIRTYSVLFDLAKYDITEYAYPFLDSLSSFLIKYNNVNIIVANHLDTRASKMSSFLITQARAESIKSYLIGSGVDSTRIEAKGHEGDQPIYDRAFINQLESQEEKEKYHAINRRTEIIFKTQPNKK